MAKLINNNTSGRTEQDTVVYCNLVESEPGRYHHPNGTAVQMNTRYVTRRNRGIHLQPFQGFYVIVDKDFALAANRAPREVIVKCIIPAGISFTVVDPNRVSVSTLIFKEICE